jgi:hypothetical protein
MASGDFPVISQPTDSTRIDIKPASPPKAFAVKPPPAPGAPKPAAAPTDARKATQSVPAVAAPKPPAAAPRPAAPPPPPAAREDEDPEKLLREYADRQKTKVNRLEVELVELRKAAAEREQFRQKSEGQAREISDLRAKLDAAGKLDGIIKDLQGKLDAAILSNGMVSDENGKLKAKVQELAAAKAKLEERAGHAEKSLADASKALASEKEARRDAEGRVAAALQALRPAAPPAPKK